MKKKLLFCAVTLLLITCLFSGCGLSAANARLFADEPVTTPLGDGTIRYELSSAGVSFIYPSDYKMETQSVNATIALYPPDQTEEKKVSAAISIVTHDGKMKIQEHLDKAVQKLKDNVSNLEITEQKVLSAQKAIVTINADYDGVKKTESYTFNLLENNRMAICGITAPTADYTKYQKNLELILNSVEPYTAAPTTAAQNK